MKIILTVIAITIGCSGYSKCLYFDFHTMQNDSIEPIVFSQTLPVFRGGESAMRNFVVRKVRYPKREINNDIQGTILVEFTVDKKGKVSNVRTVKSVDGGENLAKAAERAVRKLPKFDKPALQNGKPVSATMTIPVIFKLTETNVEPKNNKP